jgi:hypothetical protein
MHAEMACACHRNPNLAGHTSSNHSLGVGAAIRFTGVVNAVIYGGDSHNSWAGVQKLDNQIIAAEFDTQSVSAPGAMPSFAGLVDARGCAQLLLCCWK